MCSCASQTVNVVCVQKDPKQINEISADFREECKKYGDVRKVTVYDVRFSLPDLLHLVYRNFVACSLQCCCLCNRYSIQRLKDLLQCQRVSSSSTSIKSPQTW